MKNCILRLGPRVVVLGGLVLVAATGCDDGTSPNKQPAAYTNADAMRGGELYDKFWATETGWDQSDPNLVTYNAYADFFRCKQCHGWDLLGSQGAYISRAPKTNRPNISPLDLYAFGQQHSPQEVFDALKSSTSRRPVTADLSTYNPATNATVGDQMPDLSTIFTDEDLWDLTRFLKTEATDVSTLYDFQTTGTYPTGSITFSNIGRDGDAANGDALFAQKCAWCHGPTGTLFLVDGDAFTVGSHLRAKPNEDHHKIKFGQQGTLMWSQVTTVSDLKDLYKAISDATKYPDP